MAFTFKCRNLWQTWCHIYSNEQQYFLSILQKIPNLLCCQICTYPRQFKNDIIDMSFQKPSSVLSPSVSFKCLCLIEWVRVQKAHWVYSFWMKQNIKSGWKLVYKAFKLPNDSTFCKKNRTIVDYFVDDQTTNRYNDTFFSRTNNMFAKNVEVLCNLIHDQKVRFIQLFSFCQFLLNYLGTIKTFGKWDKFFGKSNFPSVNQSESLSEVTWHSKIRKIPSSVRFSK